MVIEYHDVPVHVGLCCNYTADLVALIASFVLSPHLYADNTDFLVLDVDVFLKNVNECLSAVADWMIATVCKNKQR